MQGLYDFIVRPVGQRYNNEINVGEVKLITNTTIEAYKHVNNIAEVVETPLVNNTCINKGDLIMIHHNVFRRFYDIRGVEKNSKSYFRDGLYFCNEDQIYLFKNDNKWSTVADRCFVKPIKNTDKLSLDKLKSNVGILKYGNSSLEALEINEGCVVIFQPNTEFEFVVDKELLYCMKSNNIIAKHEHKGDQKEYNPSWTSSS
tara:strand:+ start:14861 stop:15466 length:606 start_codon:yes stop_codon:yes gene_type:complete